MIRTEQRIHLTFALGGNMDFKLELSDEEEKPSPKTIQTNWGPSLEHLAPPPTEAYFPERYYQGHYGHTPKAPKKIVKEIYTDFQYTKMPFGKYKGTYLKDIPDSYIKWAVLNIQDKALAEMFKIELQRRDKGMR